MIDYIGLKQQYELNSSIRGGDPCVLIVLLFLQRAQSELAAHQKKILHVDNHVGISIAGLTADARLLW